MKLNSIERNHSEWLTLVDINGPFLSFSVLTDHYPNGIDRVTPVAYQDLKEGFAEWEGSQKTSKPNPEMHSIWMEYVLKVLLGFSKEILNKEQVLESTKYQHLKMDLGTDKIYPDYLIPDVEYREEIGKAKLAVFVYPSSQDTREKFIGDAKLDSPLSRASQYLKSTGVPFALVTNGSRWTLIHTGKSELTGYASWESKIWVEERIHLDSFYTLLRKERFFGLSPERTLEKLYEKSRNDQQDVTEQISLQVRNAIEIYIQNLDKIDVGNEGKLLKDISESKIYEAALTLMMRLLVLFFAEENKFLQSENELYENFYSISRLGEELRKVADQKGEEVLERRYDAYARLIACFRLIFQGSDHPELPVVAYGGSLFDPGRFPFLEGRVSSEEQVSILKIDNRTTLHLLEALQFLQTKLPGDSQVIARRMSFKSLDIEDIGHIYESLLEYTAKRADKITLSFQATRSQSVKFTLEEVEKIAEKELVDFFKTETGRTENFIKRALKGDIDYDKGALDAACQDPKLTVRIRRYAALLQKDSYNRPVILQKDAIYIDFGSSRRSTGTHYTPAELTKTVVINLLECLVYEGVREGKPRKVWKLKSPEEILKLKVCDISMGSGAFLVQVCRYLAERLLESWTALENCHPEPVERVEGRKSSNGNLQTTVLTLPYGKPSTGNAKEELLAKDKKEREAQALRLVADRCIYGVDLNPLAVEMAKVSLWLVTMQKDKPFTFLDHALKCGDSLLGLEFSEFKRLTQITDKEGNLAIEFYNSLIVEYMEALDLRTQILEIDDNTPEKVRLKENLHKEANSKLTRIKAGCDLFVGGILLGIKEAGLVQLGLDISLGKEEENRHYPQIREILKRYKPFHWELEFPEVFTILTPVDSAGNSLTPLQKGEGFDAFAGNPPFMGGKKITGEIGVSYRDYLVERLANKQKGSADLSSYFFLRAFRFLSPSGVMGLIATNTIAQGDTREVGLESIIKQKGIIYRAIQSMEWPNAAAVFVSICWIVKGEWKGATLVKESGEEINMPAISSYLTKKSRVDGKPFQLKVNENKSFQGSVVLGMGFVLESKEALDLQKNTKNKDCLYPYLNGEDLNSRPDQSPSRWVIQFFDWPLSRKAEGKWGETSFEKENKNKLGSGKGAESLTPSNGFTFYKDPLDITKTLSIERRDWLRVGIVPSDYPYPVAEDYPDLLNIIEAKVKPQRMLLNREVYKIKWWQFAEKQTKLYSIIDGMERVMVRSRVANMHFFHETKPNIILNERLAVLTIDSYAILSIVSSNIHEYWAREYSSSLKEDMMYSPSDCFETFPFPNTQTENELNRLQQIGEDYNILRKSIMLANNEGLTKTYNRFHISKPLPYPQFKNDEISILNSEKNIQRLRDLHKQMDYAVRDAYGWNDLDLEHGFHETKQGMRYTVSDRARVEILDRLLELNHKRYAEEVQEGKHGYVKRITEKVKSNNSEANLTLFSDVEKIKQNEVTMITPSLDKITLDQLYFDPNNYRFIDNEKYEEIKDSEFVKPDIQKRTYRFLIGEDKDREGIKDLLDSFKSNGFLPIEKIQVRPIEGESGKYIVTEGNRRTAALKYLKEEYDKGNSIGNFNPEVFENVPVIRHEEVSDLDNLVMIGLNHISGKREWPALNQAKLMRKMADEYKMHPDEIVKKLGISKQYFNRSQRTLYLIDQYLESDYGDQFATDKYNYFQEIVNSPDLRQWIGWDEKAYQATDERNLERLFSLISTHEDESEEGEYKKVSEPAITKSSELRLLASIVTDEKALRILESTRNITAAITSSDAIGKSKIQAALDIIHEQINVAFNFSGFLENHDLDRMKDAVQKINGVLTARNVDPQLRIQAEVKKGDQFADGYKAFFMELQFPNFKRFQKLQISNLSRINIFAGKNNTGKTTLLEAIYLLTKMNDINGVLEIINRRAKVDVNNVSVKWLDEQIKDFSISAKLENSANIKVDLVNNKDASEVESTAFFVNTILLTSKHNEDEFESRSFFFENKDRETSGSIKYLCTSVYSSPFSMNSSEIIKACNEISLKRKIEFNGEKNISAKEVVMKFIREFIDKDIRNIELVNDFNRFSVSHKTQDTFDLSQYGEGLQRVFYISLLFAYAENGIVCIDEFENAIYFGLLKEFTKLIQELAVIFNVQVFITTHSKECIDAFIENEYRTEDISAYKLANEDGKIVPYYFSGQELAKYIDLIDLDLRESK